MSNWIDEEVQGFANDDDERKRQDDRLALITSQSPRLWGELKLEIEAAVQELNKRPELRKIVGQLTCRPGYTQHIEVHKQTFPAIYLTVTTNSRDFGVHRRIVPSHRSTSDTEQRETLDLDLDSEGRIFMRNKDGKPLALGEAVHYLFAPFLHPELLGIKGVE